MLVPKLPIVEAAHHDEEAAAQGEGVLRELEEPVAEEEHASSGKGYDHEGQDYQEVAYVADRARDGVCNHSKPRLGLEGLEEAHDDEDSVVAREDPVEGDHAREASGLRVQQQRPLQVPRPVLLVVELEAGLLHGALPREVDGPLLELVQHRQEDWPAGQHHAAAQHSAYIDPSPEAAEVAPRGALEDGLEEGGEGVDQEVEPEDQPDDVQGHPAVVLVRLRWETREPDAGDELTAGRKPDASHDMEVNRKIGVEQEHLHPKPRSAIIDPGVVLQRLQLLHGPVQALVGVQQHGVHAPAPAVGARDGVPGPALHFARVPREAHQHPGQGA
mmetsp:Transcript_94967/g.277689  ORF Transcript_94967/g.277689 Transcript_94967/m.277689 type:complete len:330 (+) Transcript_94967:850-1839(+)